MNEAAPKSLFWYRVKLLALIAVFLSPFIGGWLAFYVFELRPSAGNYGRLVQPVQRIDWPPLETADGERIANGFEARWAFVLFAGKTCAEQCRNNLFYMRQIRTLLGRDTLRLQNVLITSAPLDQEIRDFLREFPNLAVIENFQVADLYRQFQIKDLEPVGRSPRLYLVDPKQNLMMTYPADNDQNRVLEDLKKLMKLSQIG